MAVAQKMHVPTFLFLKARGRRREVATKRNRGSGDAWFLIDEDSRGSICLLCDLWVSSVCVKF